MSFKFLVERTGRVPSAGICFVEGTVQDGKVKGGETARVEEMANQSVAIKSVALVNMFLTLPDTVTLSIAEPNFPLEDLCGRRLIGEAESDNVLDENAAAISI